MMVEFHRLGSTRDTIAAAYAVALQSQRGIDWAAINAEIMTRYSPSGLNYIKRRAWAIYINAGLF